MLVSFPAQPSLTTVSASVPDARPALCGSYLSSCTPAVRGSARASKGGSTSTAGFKNVASQTPPVYTGVTLTFLEAVLGAQKTIKAEVRRVCPDCNGRRVRPGVAASTCGFCRGTGHVLRSRRGTRTALRTFLQGCSMHVRFEPPGSSSVGQHSVQILSGIAISNVHIEIC